MRRTWCVAVQAARLCAVRRAHEVRVARRAVSSSVGVSSSLVPGAVASGKRPFVAWQQPLSSTVKGYSTAPNPDDSGEMDDGFYLPDKFRRKSKKDRYELVKELGRGHYAVVFEANDMEKQRKVAVKVMDKRQAPREICKNELEILNELTARGEKRFTPIMDVFEDDTKLYFVLELMRGGDFFEKVYKSGKVSEKEAAFVVRKLCFALNALHEHKILHRDVKLENLLLDGHEEAELEVDRLPSSFKVADLGFAKRMDQNDSFKNPAGTLGYVAPEVLRSRQYSPACDVWSAGIVLYILLSGNAPFPPKNGVKVGNLKLEQQLEVELEAIEHGREQKRWEKHLQRGPWAKVSQDAKKLLSKMLHLDPQKRVTTQHVLSDQWIINNTMLRSTEYLNFE